VPWSYSPALQIPPSSPETYSIITALVRYHSTTIPIPQSQPKAVRLLNEDMPSIHSSSNETPLDIAGPIAEGNSFLGER
jgi:hypothetical protein